MKQEIITLIVFIVFGMVFLWEFYKAWRLEIKTFFREWKKRKFAFDIWSLREVMEKTKNEYSRTQIKNKRHKLRT